MKVLVRAKKFRLSLRLPMCLCIWILRKAAAHGAKTDRDALVSLLDREHKTVRDILRRARRVHGRLELVRVEAQDGTRVLVTL